MIIIKGVIRILTQTRYFVYTTIIFLCGFSLLVGLQNVFALYTMTEDVFNWTTEQVGTMFSIFWVYRALAVAGFIPLITHFFPSSKGYWPPMLVTK